ncbi:MAG: MgtC/SapB family protein [Mycoplasmatota bacterium]|nr:MgtC/SapB family protein [Mycoplasmatota bacterium]
MNFNTFILGMLLCFLLSFVLGIERQIRRRSLGLRTMILVALGSYMFVSFSFLINNQDFDITRVAAQVVTGIGFFGAGVIIKDNERNIIRGLTTAATLWCDAALGMLCAGGFIKEAIVSTIFVLFANIVLRYVNEVINRQTERKNTSETFSIKITSEKDLDKINTFINNFIKKENNIEKLSYKVNEKVITLNIKIIQDKDDLIEKLLDNLIKEYSIKNYEYKKLSSTKLEEEQDEM